MSYVKTSLCASYIYLLAFLVRVSFKTLGTEADRAMEPSLALGTFSTSWTWQGKRRTLDKSLTKQFIQPSTSGVVDQGI